MQQPFSLSFVRRAAFVCLPMLALVVPFAVAASRTPGRTRTDVMIAAATALAVGLGTMLRLRGAAAATAGFVVGTLSGLTMAIVVGTTPGYGIAIIIPPVVGLGTGLLDGIAEERLVGVRAPLVASLAMGVMVGIGTLPAAGIGTLFAGVVFGLWLGMLLGMRVPGRRRWRPRLRWPPWWIAIIALVLAGLVVAAAVDEFVEDMGMPRGAGIVAAIGTIMVALVVIPLLSFAIGTLVARWLAPRLAALTELTAYLRVMAVPIGAFTLGALVIVVLFAGLYGTLHRFDPAAFAGAPEAPGILEEWIFFSIYNAVAADYNAIAPVSVVARILVFLQLILGVGWAVVVFAAVMAHVQPAMEAIARDVPE